MLSSADWPTPQAVAPALKLRGDSGVARVLPGILPNADRERTPTRARVGEKCETAIQSCRAASLHKLRKDLPAPRGFSPG